jgi:serine/threonine protein phosphatase PrpC
MQFKRCSNGDVFGFFGVFDGHGGPTAANYVRDSLFANLERSNHFPGHMDAALSVFSSADYHGTAVVAACVENVLALQTDPTPRGSCTCIICIWRINSNLW